MTITIYNDNNNNNNTTTTTTTTTTNNNDTHLPIIYKSGVFRDLEISVSKSDQL